ncbi:MAG TPA: hypothetical protein VMR62_18340, partial [Bryobacteraceae bacterium]|nr:hypothetical protein [Bryobacteraceae bacterium]
AGRRSFFPGKPEILLTGAEIVSHGPPPRQGNAGFAQSAPHVTSRESAGDGTNKSEYYQQK